MDSQVARQRSLVAVAHRKRDPDAIQTATRDLAAAKLADYISRTVAAAPPLSADQLSRLSVLLRGGPDAAA